MSLAEIEKQVLELPEEERRQFAHWFYDHEQELTGEAEDDAWAYLSPEQTVEMKERLKEIDEHPERLLPWEEVEERLRKEIYGLQDHDNLAR